MNANNIRQSTIESRLSLLEKRLRTYQAIGGICIVLAMVAVASGAFQGPGVYQAPSYEVVDSNGNLRAAFGLDNAGQPALFFFNIQGGQGDNRSVRIIGTDGKQIFTYFKKLEITNTPARAVE